KESLFFECMVRFGVIFKIQPLLEQTGNCLRLFPKGYLWCSLPAGIGSSTQGEALGCDISG
ncbi:hypothetical protein, partial [Rhodohalobacter sulfatireducens]